MKAIYSIALAMSITAMPLAMNAVENSAPETKTVKYEKASKDARNEAKALKKEGYKAAPGALPIDKQLDKAWDMRQEYDSNGQPKYYFGTGNAVGMTFDAARLQAVTNARTDLAKNIEDQVTQLVENSLANEQYDTEDAMSITHIVAESKNIMTQKLQRTQVVYEIMRTLPNKNIEVQVLVAMPTEQVVESTDQARRKALQKSIDDLKNRVN